jgi:MtN3 and saliva related transmembrane protein
MSAEALPLTEAVGAFAAVCSTASFLPQLIKVIREKAAEAVSLRMYVLTVSGFTLWTIYGVLLGSAPLVASNLVSLGLSSAILALTLRYRGRAAPDPGAGTGSKAAPDPA